MDLEYARHLLERNRSNQSLADQRAERKAWSPKEDETIVKLVDKHGTKSWTLIAQELSKVIPGSNRTGKQCRTRL